MSSMKRKREEQLRAFRAGAAARIFTPRQINYVVADREENEMPYSWSAIASAPAPIRDIDDGGSGDFQDSQDYGIAAMMKCMIDNRGMAIESHDDESVKIEKTCSPPPKKLFLAPPTARETARRCEAEWLRDAEAKDMKIRQLTEVNRGLHAAKQLYESMYEKVLRETQLLRRFIDIWAPEKVDAATSP